MYQCIKCDWKGDKPPSYTDTDLGGPGTSYYICPNCGSPVEDLDLDERIAIRTIDAGQSEAEATEKAKEEIERWMREE